MGALEDAFDRFEARAAAARPNRYYGDGGTIHSTGHLHVEVKDGEVVAVWFRCQMLPFEQVNVDEDRAASGLANQHFAPRLVGVEVSR